MRALFGWTCSGLLAIAMFVAAPLLHADEFTFRHEHVLGTSMQLTLHAATQRDAEAIERTTLQEIDRLDVIFSRYRADSQLMRWQRGELTVEQTSEELRSVVEMAERWRVETGGAFDVRVLALENLWKSHAERRSQPTQNELDRLVAQLQQPPYDFTGDRLTGRRDQLALTFDAIAKGFILDAVVEHVRQRHPQVEEMAVMIGGDVKKIGSRAFSIGIANPRDAADNSPSIAELELHGPIGMATSGGYRRNLNAGGRLVSHILDPRTGLPAETMLSATVVAPTACQADAAATALSVLGPVDGLKMIETRPGFACLMVLNSGDVIQSERWAVLTGSSQISAKASSVRLVSMADTKTQGGLLVKFALARGEGGRYRRPYVAVWLEDKDGFPVKTAVLWLQTDGPGPRWHRDLTRWWADDRMRKLVEDKELIGTISGATRGPGEYEARFDMTDNAGKALPNGKYTLCLEAAREHGTHQLIREEIDIKGTALPKKDLKGGTEISTASYRFEPVQADTKTR